MLPGPDVTIVSKNGKDPLVLGSSVLNYMCGSMGLVCCRNQTDHTILQMVLLCWCSHHKGAGGQEGITCAIIVPGRYRWVGLYHPFCATHIGTMLHCICHIPNMPHVFHMGLPLATSPAWKSICHSSHNQWCHLW